MIRYKKIKRKWTSERVTLLKQLWADGLTGGQIAKKIGGFDHCKDGGRGSVLAKVRKLGLENRKGVGNYAARGSRKQPKKAVQRSSRIRSVRGNAVQELFASTPSEPQTEELVIPLEERKTLDMLTETSCRWPIGDVQHQDFHFCGRKKMTDLPYCEFHARRAFQPPNERSRESVEPTAVT